MWTFIIMTIVMVKLNSCNSEIITKVYAYIINNRSNICDTIVIIFSRNTVFVLFLFITANVNDLHLHACLWMWEGERLLHWSPQRYFCVVSSQPERRGSCGTQPLVIRLTSNGSVLDVHDSPSDRRGVVSPIVQA